MLIIIATLFVMLACGIAVYRTRSKKTRSILLQVVAGCGLVLLGTIVTAVASTRNTANIKRHNNLRITRANAAASASMASTYKAARSQLNTNLIAYKALAFSIENNLLVVWQQNGHGEQATVAGASYNSQASAVKSAVNTLRAAGKYKQLKKLNAKIQANVGSLTENGSPANKSSVSTARSRSKALVKLTDLLENPGDNMDVQHAQFNQQMNIINNQNIQ